MHTRLNLKSGLLFTTVVLTAMTTTVSGGKGGCIDGWYNVINETNTANYTYDNHKPPPSTNDINRANNDCPPEEGTLLLRCVSDPNHDWGFFGSLYADKYITDCTWENGSVCMSSAYHAHCPDFALQLGCDCGTPEPQVTTPMPGGAANTVPPLQCPGSNTTATTTATGTVPQTTQLDCPCLKDSRQRGNSGNVERFQFTVLLVCFIGGLFFIQ